MRVGLIGDTHDHIVRSREAVAILNRADVEAVIHVGDYCSPFLVRELRALKAPLHGITGNNDGDIFAIRAAFDAIGGRLEAQWWETSLDTRRVLVMHEPRGVDDVAASGEFDLIVFGHTHQRVDRSVGRTRIVNPGEICGWLTGEPSLAIYETERGEIDFHAF